MLDNGTLTFAADPHEGISYLVAMGVLEDRSEAIAEFIHNTTLLDWKSLERLLRERYTTLLYLLYNYRVEVTTTVLLPLLPLSLLPLSLSPPRRDVLQVLVKLHRYDNMFLPDALRKFFSLIPAPNERGQHLETLLNLFSQKYIECNPSLDLGSGEISQLFPQKVVENTNSLSLCRYNICGVLLSHSLERGPHQSARQEQDVKKRVHP